MTDVVISHVAADAEIAAWLADRMHAAGILVFLLEWVEPGLVPILEQEHALTAATHGMLLISRATMADPAVREEYAALVQHARSAAGHRFIPVLVGEITDLELPRFAAIRQPVDLRNATGGEDRAARIDALLRSLRRAAANAGPDGGAARGPEPIAGIGPPARIRYSAASGDHAGPGTWVGDHIRILLLAANPHTTAQLAIDEEAREIAEKLRLSRDRDMFDLVTCWAVRPADLLQQLNRYRPQIVHFSGHGDRAGKIVFAADAGTGLRVGSLAHRDTDVRQVPDEARVSTAALAELFRVMKDQIRVVVLNACYSATQAQAIGQHIDYIVGMRSPIADEAAVVFAAAFYSALGFGRTVPQAFEQATTALMLHGLPGRDIPELLVRPGADPRLRIDR